jgi:predicted aconitase
MPVSGACVMCHIIGTTPGSNTQEEAFNQKKPIETHVIGKREVREIYQRLNDSDSDKVDMVVLGCPHLTIVEIEFLAKAFEGKKVHSNVRVVIGISKTAYALAKECGFIDILESRGGIMVNTCVSGTNPFLFSNGGIGVAATNSARAAHYMQRMSGGKTKTFYGNMQKCVQSAITGQWAG